MSASSFRLHFPCRHIKVLTPLCPLEGSEDFHRTRWSLCWDTFTSHVHWENTTGHITWEYGLYIQYGTLEATKHRYRKVQFRVWFQSAHESWFDLCFKGFLGSYCCQSWRFKRWTGSHHLKRGMFLQNSVGSYWDAAHCVWSHTWLEGRHKLTDCWNVASVDLNWHRSQLLMIL